MSNPSLEIKIAHEREADKAIAQYDGAVFALVGKTITEKDRERLTVLAFYAVQACETVMRDQHNGATVAHYKAHRDSIHAIELTPDPE